MVVEVYLVLPMIGIAISCVSDHFLVNVIMLSGSVLLHHKSPDFLRGPEEGSGSKRPLRKSCDL